jgi:hypothetical protein
MNGFFNADLGRDSFPLVWETETEGGYGSGRGGWGVGFLMYGAFANRDIFFEF